MLKILALDIETAPHTGYVWNLFKEYIPLERLIQTGRVMCFSAKLVDAKGKPVFYSEHEIGHEEMILAAHAVLEDTDVVLTYNGKKFDVPMLNKEFAKYGLTPPAPFHHIDLYQIVRRKFKLASNKLAHVLDFFGLSKKVDHRGFGLWVDCMNGDAKAWKEMEKYNKQDVASLIELYEFLLPWIDNHPNHGTYVDGEDPVCTNCASDDVQSRGFQHNRTMSYKRFQCNDCGTWLRARVSEPTHKSKLVQIGGR
jgi:DNA polymerase elongation subunit (family B)